MSRIITLTTDFGLTDEYVGVMKGVILSRAPDAKIVDLCHGIGYQNIQQAAYLIHSSGNYFPMGTVHAVVVDPSVGTGRKIVLLAIKGQYYLAPDNGVLTLLARQNEVDFVREVAREDLYVKPVSRTFHGRDIFAPVAACLANGMPAEEIGPLLDPKHLCRLSLPDEKVDCRRNSITGAVIRIDHFGNLLTNISRQAFLTLCREQDDIPVAIKINDVQIIGIQSSYYGVAEGELLAIFSSMDTLEIAVNKGSAARKLLVGVGEKVLVTIKTNLSLYK